MQQANGGINVKTSSGSAGSQQSKGSGGASGLQHQQTPPASSGSSTSKSVVDTSSSSASHNGAFWRDICPVIDFSGYFFSFYNIKIFCAYLHK